MTSCFSFPYLLHLNCPLYLVLSKICRVFLDVLPADPIAQLHRCFCRKLLERAVHTLIQPQSDSEAGKHKSDSG